MPPTIFENADSTASPEGGRLRITESSLFVKLPSMDELLAKCVEELWTLYDNQCLGYLDRQQSKLFVEDALLGRSLEITDDDDDENIDGDFTEKEFN